MYHTLHTVTNPRLTCGERGFTDLSHKTELPLTHPESPVCNPPVPLSLNLHVPVGDCMDRIGSEAMKRQCKKNGNWMNLASAARRLRKSVAFSKCKSHVSGWGAEAQLEACVGAAAGRVYGHWQRLMCCNEEVSDFLWLTGAGEMDDGGCRK